MENSKKIIQLSKNDNVLVVCRNVLASEILQYNGLYYTVKDSMPLGHKVAARDIALGESIIKFNVPIGSAFRNIKKGEHVHLHNMKSDFIPTYTIEGRDKEFI